MKTTLTVLNDNEPGPGLLNDWGWSVLVEGRYKFLFDADTRPEILEYNSRKLGVSLENLDFIFLSHWHADHYGGMPYVGKLNPRKPLYAPPGGNESWGMKLVYVDSPRELGKGVWSTGGEFEQALGLETDKGLVVLVGCSHPGVDNLTRILLGISGYDRAYLVIGGFHMPGKRTVDSLAQMTEMICPAHCTGPAKEYIKKSYPEKYCPVRTGTRIEI